ncbi:MAG TPA: FadR/GntR family transcriptional regulator [Candidatus Bathyarchaeia archaeon]|nr:FadR/GntR family transcriptional regulator [Candidatus Bathyarchaeia archaeon]
MPVTEAPARTGFEAISRNKVYQEVARQLERHILEQLKPGDLLPPERQLGELLGVSRGSVRDAIRSLELKGLLEPRQGIGTVVCDPGASTSDTLANALLDKRQLVAELIDVRKMIEPHVAARAALHASDDDIVEMQDILARQGAKVRRGEPATEEDTEFHYAMALASRNRAIVKVMENLMDVLRETREKSSQGKGRPQKSLAGHRRILAALKRHDAAAAEAAVYRHLQEIETIALNKL